MVNNEFMKTILQSFLLLLCAISLSAQSNVTIKINHLLEGETFEYEKAAVNDLGNDFHFDRLEYYLSTFSIVHDGGQVTTIDDLYVLISMENKTPPIQPTEIDLGEFDIQNIEAVNFYFGIDEEANHADPSLWPSDHPLAPKLPSMHWGWAAGYRFIALEGLSGPNIDQELQFHCIGDEFYEEMSFPVSMSGEDAYVVEIDAEYTNLLSSIDVSDGLILHGNLNEIQTLATNLKEEVFTAAEVTSTEDHGTVKSFTTFPNPTTDGWINMEIDLEGDDYSIEVMDILGKRISTYPSGTTKIYLPESGLYYISIFNGAKQGLATRRVIVK